MQGIPAAMGNMADQKSEMAITFESLFDLLRREKTREALQKLDGSFYKDVKAYILEKQQLVTSFSGQDMASRQKTEMQLENVRKMLHELYERREKKVMSMALNESRTGMRVDYDSLLDEEKRLHDSLLHILNENRQKQLGTLFSQDAKNKAEVSDTEGKKPEAHESAAGDIAAEGTDEMEPAAGPTNTVIRFIHAVPKFIGTELEEYGPYEEEEIANLPNEIANVLIERGRAEKIEER